MQPDFMPGGALAIAEGDAILQPISRLMTEGPFWIQVATQDWHPAGHISFASSHPGHQPMDTIELYGHEQVLWPDHCVQGTPGARLHPDLPVDRALAILRKATESTVDTYSAFRNNWNEHGERPTTGLAGYLRDRGVSEVYICGLARDVCVQWSVEDAIEAGFTAHVIWDLTRSVDPSADEAVRSNLAGRGAEILTASELWDRA
jgi:nicotinamidase/pyrazinamidase